MNEHDGAFTWPAEQKGGVEIAGGVGDFFPGFAEGDFEGAIESEADGTLIVVLNDKGDGLVEVGVDQVGGGDKELALS